jgi:hypothetical protein
MRRQQNADDGNGQMKAQGLVALAFAVLVGAMPAQTEQSLVEQLRDPLVRVEAARLLSGRGPAAAVQLLRALDTKPKNQEGQDFGRQILAVLASLGRGGCGAIPELAQAFPSADKAMQHAVMATLAELAIHDPSAAELQDGRISRFGGYRGWSSATAQEFERLRVRRTLGAILDTTTAIQVAGGVRAYAVEAAVDVLNEHGLAAAGALPTLLRLLELPDPRVADSDRRVPLRAKAARAILAIAPGQPAAVQRAQAVLSGQAPETAPKDFATPERLTTRIADLVIELGASGTRERAIDNLVALGPPAARPLVDALARPQTETVRTALLNTLRRMGPAAAHVGLELRSLIWQLPLEDTASLCDALAATGTWSRDILTVVGCSWSETAIVWHGRRLPGKVDRDNYTATSLAYDGLRVALDVDPTWPPALLAAQLRSPDGNMVLHTLGILRQRGVDARPVLGAIEDIMKSPLVKTGRSELLPDGSLNHRILDRSDDAKRMAAAAVLAIAPADHPAVDLARRFATASSR